MYFDDFKVEHIKSPVIQSEDYYPFGLSFNSYQRENALSNQYLYNGKEMQDELSVNWYDFGHRMFDQALGRWWVVDPLSEKRYWMSPYNYVQNNPINRFDPNGLTDFTLNKKTGDVQQVGEKNDDPDRILKTNRHGEVKHKRNGEAKVAVGGIEQGILKDGQNFKTQNNIIKVGGDGQPTQKGVESFALKLSKHIGREVGGAYFGGQSTTHMTIGSYHGNSHKESKSSGHQLGLQQGLALTGFFHTHPGNGNDIADSDRLVPSDNDLNARNNALKVNPSLRFYLLTQPSSGDEPLKIDYTTGFSFRLK